MATLMPAVNGSKGECLVKKRSLDGIKTYVTEMTCENPIAEIHFIKGFKSHPKYYEDFLKTMHDNGINVVMVTLPDPGDNIDYLEDYEKIAKALLIDGALDRSGYPPTPKFIVTHSTGGYLLTKQLMDEQKAASIHERYQGAYFAAPYYGSKYHRMRGIAPLGRLYSRVFADSAVGTTWLERKGSILLDRLFNQAADPIEVMQNGIEEDEDLKAIANHRQGLYMDGPTRALINEIEAHGFPDAAKSFPTLFLTGTTDNVCLNSLTEKVAGAIGGLHVSVQGGHSLLRKTQEAPSLLMDYIRTRLHQMKMDAIQEQCANAQKLLPFYPPEGKKTEIQPQDLPVFALNDHMNDYPEYDLGLAPA